jgi:putative toxin-antitoxin system antitoxin component (TIGR02293 family)
MEPTMHLAVSQPRPRSAAEFWSLPAHGLEKSWLEQWDRLVEQIGDSDPLTLYRAVEDGVPVGTVLLLSKALNEPAPQVLALLGLPETTFRRKSGAGGALPEVAGHRAVALMRVVAQLRQLLAESGDPAQTQGFDLGRWISAWIKEPLPELGGETPMALLRNPEGQRVVETLLERMRGGLVA